MSMKVNMDVVGQDKIRGDLANYAMQQSRLDPGLLKPYQLFGDDDEHLGNYVTVYKGGDPKKLSSYRMVPVTNATLRRDEWKALDDAVQTVSEKRLIGIQDLIDNGLTYNLGNAMGSTVLEWHDVNDAFEAELSMDGITRGQNDRVEYGHNYLPIPIIHVDYRINARVLQQSRNMGNPLDTTQAERAARKVNEKLESMLFTDTKFAFGGGKIYSYVNHPSRMKYTMSDKWTNYPTSSGTSLGEEIVNDVIGAKQMMIDNYQFGPFKLYTPTGYETLMDKDYDNTRGNTIRERIEAISGIDSVQVVDTLPDDQPLLVQMSSDTVRLVRGMGIQNIEWNTEGNFVNNYKVMTIQVPQIRADANGRTGIVHMATSH